MSGAAFQGALHIAPLLGVLWISWGATLVGRLLIALLILLSFLGTGVWPSFRYPDDGYGLSTLLLIIVLLILIVVLLRRRRL